MVVVIILSRGAGGGADIIRPVSLSRVVTHSQPPSPDMVLTLQLPVSRTFKLVLQTIHRFHNQFHNQREGPY